MTPPPDGSKVIHDEAGKRFYLPLEGGQDATLLYRRQAEVLDFYRTYVPVAFREKGLAEKVVEAGFRFAQSQNLKVLPTCPYVAITFLARRPEFRPLVNQ